MGSEKENPRLTDALAGDVNRGSDSFQKLPERIERYSRARGVSEETIAFFNAIYKGDYPYCEEWIATDELGPIIRRMETCSQWLWFRHYYTQGVVRLAKVHTCQIHLLCPLCAIRRGAKAVKAYLDRFEVVRQERPQLRAYLLTLTVANGSDLAERFSHLAASWRTYLERRRDSIKKGRGLNEMTKVEGGCFAFETTHDDASGGWHPHLHAVIMVDPSNPIDFPADGTGAQKKASSLAQEWASITGDSYIVDCRPIDASNPSQAFVEVFKYAVKFSDLDDWLKLRAYQTLRGKRLTGSFGCFWGVKVPESDADELLEDLPYAELLYRYTKAGYSLASITAPEGAPVASWCESVPNLPHAIDPTA